MVERKANNRSTITFCFLITSFFCFGYAKESVFSQRVPLKLPLVYSHHLGSAFWNEKLDSHTLSTRKQQNLLNNYNSNIEEFRENKTPFWQKAGIYTLELIGAGVGMYVSFNIGIFCSGILFDNPPYSIERALIGYTIGNLLLTSTCTWAVGSLLNGNHSWWKAALGAGAGCLVGISAIALEKKVSGFPLGVLLAAPPLGAVVGYNIK
ncbi:MAG: hypothetical protein ABIK93_01655 [candidate division WOR-3 bacterium]